MDDQDSDDLTGWLIQLEAEDEFFRYQIAKAITMAFSNAKGQAGPPASQEEVIDTTAPSFAKQFKGFIGSVNTQIIQG